MNKIKLQLEDLVIDSFSTTPVRRAKGTVYGEQCTCETACTCPGCATCDDTCADTCTTCGYTGDYSCESACDLSCNQYTCQGFQTYAGPKPVCYFC